MKLSKLYPQQDYSSKLEIETLIELELDEIYKHINTYSNRIILNQCAILATAEEALLDLLNFKSSKIRIVILVSIVSSLLYLTGCCDKQQQGPVADGGRRDTKGIVASDKPDVLPDQQPQSDNVNSQGQVEGTPVANDVKAETDAKETGTDQKQAEDGNEVKSTGTDVVDKMAGTVNPAGAGLTPGEGSTADKIDDSDRVQPADGENTPMLEDQKEEIVEVSTEEL